MSNKNLHAAKKAKNDEFYTQLKDIENEISNYDSDHFKNKTIYCNCDDYRWSNFVKYFKDNFSTLGIKKLIATNYDIGDCAWKYEYDGENETITKLEGNGNFKSDECVEILKSADIVITNPAFSSFRSYVKQLMDYGKKFLIIGNSNAITFKEIFPYLKDNQLWLGINYVKEFIQPNGEIKKFGNICWFTNVENNKRNKPLDLYKKYNPTDYKIYDNYDAINVDKVKDIPIDYNGVLGVPITILKYLYSDGKIHVNIDGVDTKFEIVGWNRHNDLEMDGGYWQGGKADATINGKEVYRRIFIKKIL